MSRSSEWTLSISKNEAHPWLNEKVYAPARQRTVDLIRQAVDSLVKQGQRVSLATVIAESKKIDPEGRGISKGGILGNPDAKAYYDLYKSWKGSTRRKSVGSGSQNVATVQSRIEPNRDIARVRNRLNRKIKDDLIARVLELEQGFAVNEAQWLGLNDELLYWRLRAEKAEELNGKMRRVLDAKEAQIQGLLEKLNGVQTSGSGQ